MTPATTTKDNPISVEDLFEACRNQLRHIVLDITEGAETPVAACATEVIADAVSDIVSRPYVDDDGEEVEADALAVAPSDRSDEEIDGLLRELIEERLGVGGFFGPDMPALFESADADVPAAIAIDADYLVFPESLVTQGDEATYRNIYLRA